MPGLGQRERMLSTARDLAAWVGRWAEDAGFPYWSEKGQKRKDTR